MGYSLQRDVALRNRGPASSYRTPKTLTPGPRLQQRGLRYYSAEVGRWVNRDPIGERANLFWLKVDSEFHRPDTHSRSPAASFLAAKRHAVWMVDDASTYVFVNNLPIDSMDPFGLSAWDYVPIIGTIRAYGPQAGQRASDYSAKVTFDDCCIDKDDAERFCKALIDKEKSTFSNRSTGTQIVRTVVDLSVFGTASLLTKSSKPAIVGAADTIAGIIATGRALDKIDAAAEAAKTIRCDCKKLLSEEGS